MVYLIALLIAVTGIFFDKRMSPAFRKSYLLILCLYVILVIGFRYKVGLDTIGYMKYYSRMPDLAHFFSPYTFSKFRFEPGYLFICALCKSISPEFWLLQMVVGAITNGCIFIFFYKYCRNVFIGIALYLLLHALYFSTEIMREGMAVGIFLLNVENLFKKKWLNFYLLSLLSIMFHYSAIVTLFFPLAQWIRLNWIFILLCVFFIAITPLVERLNGLLQFAAISGRIDRYMEIADTLNFNWRIGELIKSAFPAIATVIILKYRNIHTRFLFLILLQIIFCMGAFAIPLVFSRFTNYTTLFVTLTIANILAIPKVAAWLRTVLISGVILSQAYNFYLMYDRWFPYVSVFYPENVPQRTRTPHKLPHRIPHRPNHR